MFFMTFSFSCFPKPEANIGGYLFTLENDILQPSDKIKCLKETLNRFEYTGENTTLKWKADGFLENCESNKSFISLDFLQMNKMKVKILKKKKGPYIWKQSSQKRK